MSIVSEPEPGVILLLRGYLAMFGDISLSQQEGVSYYYYLAIKHPTIHGRPPTINNYLVQNFNSV